jgi:DNA invertase Pin-like site-specific DNA recombinase
MPKAAAIYARISSDPEGDRLGVTRQVDDCRAMAERRGWPVAETYVDDDISAYSGRFRPEYRRMLDDIRCGTVDAVVVWHLDRLQRQPKELEEFFEVCDAAGVRSMASVTGDTDLATHDGRFLARILGAVARKESDDKSRRITRKHEEMARAGRLVRNSTRPFGYRDDFRTLEPVEAAVIREAVGRLRAGDSLRGIAADWNERGIQTVKGGPWKVQVLRRMLASARIAGQREYKGEIVATGDWEPIITPDDSARVRALLAAASRSPNREVRRYLLSGGLLRCGVCGSGLVARPRQDGTRRYVCAKGPGLPGCGKVAIVAEPVERFLAEAVLYRLDTPELAAAIEGAAPPDDEGERANLAADRAQLEELATAYGERQITFPEYLAARKPIEARIEAGKRALARLTKTESISPYVGKASALRLAWPDLPLTRQRAIIASVLDRVVVKPAVPGRNRFDRDRLEPVWRV